MGNKKLTARKQFVRELLGKGISLDIVLTDRNETITVKRTGNVVRYDGEDRQGFYVKTPEGMVQIPLRYVKISGSSRKPGNERVVLLLPQNYNVNQLNFTPI